MHGVTNPGHKILQTSEAREVTTVPAEVTGKGHTQLTMFCALRGVCGLISELFSPALVGCLVHFRAARPACRRRHHCWTTHHLLCTRAVAPQPQGCLSFTYGVLSQHPEWSCCSVFMCVHGRVHACHCESACVRSSEGTRAIV